jgi:hypothetical protein
VRERVIAIQNFLYSGAFSAPIGPPSERSRCDSGSNTSADSSDSSIEVKNGHLQGIDIVAEYGSQPGCIIADPLPNNESA